MSKKTFTQEEEEMLRSNKFTYSVSTYTLSFTEEFKAMFWKEYQEGNSAQSILEKYGYPADVLGKIRIWGITQHIKKQYYSDKGIHEGYIRNKKSSLNYSAQTTEEKVDKLQCEVEYLRQEIDFLKKISSIKNTMQ